MSVLACANLILAGFNTWAWLEWGNPVFAACIPVNIGAFLLFVAVIVRDR
jgi:hypothetical protein